MDSNDQFEWIDDSAGESRKGRNLVLVIFGIALAGLLGIAGCAGALVLLIRVPLMQAFQNAQPAPPVAIEIESPEARQAQLQAAFSGRAPGCDAGTLAAVRDLLDQIVAATRDEENESFGELVDYERFVEQARKSGLLSNLTQGDIRSLIDEYRASPVSAPGNWSRSALFDVQPTNDRGGWLVTACFWEDDYPEVLRLWARQSVDGWKLYDWNVVRMGCSASYEHAVYIRHDGDPLRTSHTQAIRDIAEAEELVLLGQRDNALAVMKRAASRPPMPELADQMLLRLAYGWITLQDRDAALECCRRARRPDVTSGLLLLEATTAQDRGRHHEALRLADRCLDAVGDSPPVWRLKAQSLTALERYSEAAGLWEKLLEHHPDEQPALLWFAEGLPEAQQSRLEQRLLKTAQPLQAAQTLFESLWSPADAPSCRTAIALVERLAPESATLELLRGSQFEREEDFDQAAASFRRAWERETDEDRRSIAVSRYLNAMREADRLIEGYEQAPDRRRAFELLTEGIEDDDAMLTPEQLQALIEAHRQVAPDDPRLYGAIGQLRLHEQDYGAAAAAFEQARQAATADNPDRDPEQDEFDPWQSRRLEALAEAGQALEAYESIPPAESTFRTLVLSLSLKHRRESLPQLIALHRERHPDDPTLDYAEFELLRDRGQYDDALRLGLKLFERMDETDTLWWTLQSAIQEVAINAGDVSALSQLPRNATRVLPSIADRLIDSRQYEAAERLIEDRLKDSPDAPEWRMKLVDLRWDQQNDAEVARLLTPWPPRGVAASRDPYLPHYADLAIRSLLRAGRVEEARQAAESMAAQGNETPLRVLLAWERKLPELLSLLEKSDSPSRDVAALYHRPELDSIVRSSEFLPLRRLYPPHLPRLWPQPTIVLFFRSPPVLSTEQIAQAVESSLNGAGTVEALSLTSPPGDDPPRADAAWLVRHPRGTMYIAAGSTPFVGPRGLRWASLADHPRQSIVSDHRAWLLVSGISPRMTRDTRRPVENPYRLAAAWLDENCLGVHTGTKWQLLDNVPALRAAFLSENPESILYESRDAPVYLMQVESTDAPLDALQRRAGREFRRGLNHLVERIDRRQAGEVFRIRVSLKLGRAAEVHWIEVERLTDRRAYGGPTFVGSLVDGSQWIPELATGEPVAVEFRDVDDWTITTGDTVERGRPAE